MRQKKKRTIPALIIMLVLLVVLGVKSWGDKGEADLWADAKWTEDVTLGEGAVTVDVEVQMEEKSITLTIASDKTVLGDILLEHEVIEGEEGQYGLYIKSVNGVRADYDKDKAYWAIYQDGEYLMSGVDFTEVSDGAHYELVYTKE